MAVVHKKGILCTVPWLLEEPRDEILKVGIIPTFRISSDFHSISYGLSAVGNSSSSYP